MKILVADDDESIRRLLALGIRALGHEVTEATDGVEAVELALSELPAIVFLDVLMPRMNGLDALALLRARGFTGKVVIVTALPAASTERLDAGVAPDAMLAKPFRRRDIVAVLEDLGEERSGDAFTAAR